MFKQIFLIVSLFALSFMATTVYGQSNKPQESSYENAIVQESISFLSDQMSSTIELTTPEQEGSYSKKQARLILKKFFKNHPVEDFQISRSGDLSDGSTFYIGELKDKKAETFRVYMVLKKSAGSWQIHILHFTKK